MAEVLDRCQALVREADRDRFLATLFAPAEHRPALFALYAFNAEIMRIRDAAREPLPGELRLQWWREVLTGERHDEARGHPVAAALLQVMQERQLATQPLLELIEARSFDLYNDPMPTLTHFEGYAAKTSAVLFDLAAWFLQPAAHVHTLSRHAGIAAATAALLYDLPKHAARQQLYIPADIMQRHGAAAADLFARKATPELSAALAQMRLNGRRHLAEAGDLLTSAPNEILPAFLPLALTRSMLRQMARRRYDPFSPPEIPAWRRQWILWRASRSLRALAG